MSSTLAPAERTLTQNDHARLMRLLQEGVAAAGGAMQELLDASDLVAARAVPPTLITMGAQVLLQDAAGDAPAYRLTLCYPGEAEPAGGRVSVLSPVGTALLGLRVGEVARWRTPVGREGAARILAVLLQPEAAVEDGS